MKYLIAILLVSASLGRSYADSHLCADELASEEKPKVGEILKCMVKMQKDIAELTARLQDMDLPDMSQYALKEQIPDHANFVKIDDMPNPVDLSGYAKKAELPKYILIGQAGNCPAGYNEVGKLQVAIWGADGTKAARAGWNVHGDIGNGYAVTNPRLCAK